MSEDQMEHSINNDFLLKIEKEMLKALDPLLYTFTCDEITNSPESLEKGMMHATVSMPIPHDWACYEAPDGSLLCITADERFVLINKNGLARFLTDEEAGKVEFLFEVEEEK